MCSSVQYAASLFLAYVNHGLTVGIFGFVIGAFVGAFLLELLVNKESKKALRAGLGSFIGFLAGSVLRLVIGAAMIGIFVWQVLFK